MWINYDEDDTPRRYDEHCQNGRCECQWCFQSDGGCDNPIYTQVGCLDHNAYVEFWVCRECLIEVMGYGFTQIRQKQDEFSAWEPEPTANEEADINTILDIIEAGERNIAHTCLNNQELALLSEATKQLRTIIERHWEGVGLGGITSVRW